MSDNFLKVYNGLALNPRSSDPTNPQDGDVQFSDGTHRTEGLWQYYNSTWIKVGSGEGGTINYLNGTNSDAENGIGDWVEYADAADAIPVDGTGGTASIVSFTQSGISPLRGTSSFNFFKSASNGQGEGASCNFNIDLADRSQKLLISCDYLDDANFSDGDIKIFVEDVTNSKLIRLDFGEDLKGGLGRYYGMFQASSDSSSYRLIIHQSSTSTSSYTVRFDNFKVSPLSASAGNKDISVEAAGNDGSSYTANTAINFTEISDTAGAFDGTSFTAPESAYYLFVGSVRFTSSVGPEIALYVDGNDIKTIGFLGTTNQTHTFSGIQFLNKGEVATIRSTVSATLNNIADNHHINILKVGASDEALATITGRQISVEGAGNAGSSITAASTNIDFTEVSDSSASWDGSTFTAPESGFYSITGMLYFTSSASRGIQLIRSASSTLRIADAETNDTHTFNSTFYLDKGETFNLQTTSNGGTLNNNSTLHWINIIKIPDPAANIDGVATVSAAYSTDSGQSIANGSFTTIIYEDVEHDSNGAYNPSTGIYTVPISGKYHIDAFVAMVMSLSIGDQSIIEIDVDGTSKANYSFEATNTLSNVTVSLPVSTKIDLVKDQEVKIKVYQDTGISDTLVTQSKYNRFSITRIK